MFNGVNYLCWNLLIRGAGPGQSNDVPTGRTGCSDPLDISVNQWRDSFCMMQLSTR